MPTSEPTLPLSETQVAAYGEWARQCMRGNSLSAPAPFATPADPMDGLTMLTQLAEAGRDEGDVLAWLAVDMGEVLVDLHWEVIAADLESAAATCLPLRRVIAYCDFDSGVPAAVRNRLYDLPEPEEDLGRSPRVE